MQTVTVKNGTIALPKEMQKQWNGACVAVDVYGDTLSVKRIMEPQMDLHDMVTAMRRAARGVGVTKSDVEDVIRAVRSERRNA